MATQLFAPAVGNGATSADFTLTESTLLVLSGQVRASDARMAIQFKTSTGGYHTVANLNDVEISGVLPAGTYRAVRHGLASIGLERA